MQTTKLNEKYTDDAILDVAADAQYDFWQTVAKSFPEITNGDFDLSAKVAFDNAINIAIEQWLLTNQPTEKTYAVTVQRNKIEHQTVEIIASSKENAEQIAMLKCKSGDESDNHWWDESNITITGSLAKELK